MVTAPTVEVCEGPSRGASRLTAVGPAPWDGTHHLEVQCFEPLKFMVICYGSPAKLIHCFIYTYISNICSSRAAVENNTEEPREVKLSPPHFSAFQTQHCPIIISRDFTLGTVLRVLHTP